MTERRRLLFRFVVFAVLLLLLAGLQTSFWHFLFGYLTPPALWLSLFIYLMINRNLVEALFSILILSYLLSVFTSMNPGLLAGLNIVLLFLVRSIKSRLFTPNSFYYATIASMGCLVFQLVELVFSQFFVSVPVVGINWVAWIIQVLMTFVVSFIIFPLYKSIDYILSDEAKEEWRGLN